MKKLLQALMLASAISAVGAAPGFAGNQDGNNQDGNSQGENSQGRGGGAPATEIGAGVLGMLLAGGVAFYIRRRARG